MSRSRSNTTSTRTKELIARPTIKSNKTSPTDADAVELILVGVGSLDHDQITAIKAVESTGKLRVAALVGSDDTATQRFVEAFPSATFAKSLESVVAAPGALAALASSPHSHVTEANSAWRRGWHVLTLSPLAFSSAAATAMIAASKRHERLLAVWMPWRSLRSAAYLKTLCHDHLLGPLFSFNIHAGSPKAPQDGVLLELGTSAIDFLTWIIGPPTIVSYADDAMGGVEANANLELSFPEGIGGSIHLSCDWPTSNTYEFLFERAVVRWQPQTSERLFIELANAPATLDAITTPSALKGNRPLREPTAQHTKPLENIIETVKGCATLETSPADALSIIALIETCRENRTLIDQPWLAHNETVHARALSLPPPSPRS